MIILIYLIFLMAFATLFSGLVLIVFDLDDIIQIIIYKIFISSFFLCIFFTFMLIASSLFLTLCK
jgi:hypothetical protein